MAFNFKISAAAAFAFASAGVANASVVETAVSYGTAPSTWIVLISMLALAGLAVGGSRRSARPTGKAQEAPARREQPAAGSAIGSTTMRFKLPMARGDATRSRALSRLGPPSSSPARARYSLAA